MFETRVIDNFLPEEYQLSVLKTIMNGCDWKFLHDVSGNLNQQFPSHGFVHILKDPRNRSQSVHYLPLTQLFQPRFKEVVNFTDIYYNRIFLQLPLAPQYKKQHNGIHVDLPPDMPHVACVYYCNDSDGDTIIYEQTIHDIPGGTQDINITEHIRVTPKRGRAVFFDGSRYHCSSQPTINYRTIINFDLVV